MLKDSAPNIFFSLRHAACERVPSTICLTRVLRSLPLYGRIIVGKVEILSLSGSFRPAAPLYKMVLKAIQALGR